MPIRLASLSQVVLQKLTNHLLHEVVTFSKSAAYFVKATWSNFDFDSLSTFTRFKLNSKAFRTLWQAGLITAISRVSNVANGPMSSYHSGNSHLLVLLFESFGNLQNKFFTLCDFRAVMQYQLHKEFRRIFNAGRLNLIHEFD